MGSHDRPGKEAKKKPKDKGVAKLQPLSDAPQQAELIRKDRKPRHTSSESEES